MSHNNITTVAAILRRCRKALIDPTSSNRNEVYSNFLLNATKDCSVLHRVNGLASIG